jgi:hypothetical protein
VSLAGGAPELWPALGLSSKRNRLPQEEKAESKKPVHHHTSISVPFLFCSTGAESPQRRKTMKRNALGVVLAAGLLSWAAAPAMAHHSFAAEFDSNKPVTLMGTITKVEFQNPHIYFYIDVKEADGKVVNYAVEGGTPNQLRRQGWGRDSLKVGETVTVQGFSARKADAHVVNGRTVILADGRRVFGFSGAGEPTNP